VVLFCGADTTNYRPLAVLALVAGVIGCASWHNVPTKVRQDQDAAHHLLQTFGPAISMNCHRSFDAEISCVRLAQKIVWSVAPNMGGIPYGQPRGIEAVSRLHTGLCYDRSRAIEDLLVAMGFRIRHIAIYSDSVFSRPPTPSHAMTEVRTSRGWMAVGSLAQWIGLSDKGQPVPIAHIAQNGLHAVNTRNMMPSIRRMLSSHFVYVYGLYSRHGRFYAPYDRVPDVNWAQLVQNL
jgi:hypothetical protein